MKTIQIITFLFILASCTSTPAAEQESITQNEKALRSINLFSMKAERVNGETLDLSVLGEGEQQEFEMNGEEVFIRSIDQSSRIYEFCRKVEVEHTEDTLFYQGLVYLNENKIIASVGVKNEEDSISFTHSIAYFYPTYSIQYLLTEKEDWVLDYKSLIKGKASFQGRAKVISYRNYRIDREKDLMIKDSTINKRYIDSNREKEEGDGYYKYGNIVGRNLEEKVSMGVLFYSGFIL